MRDFWDPIIARFFCIERADLHFDIPKCSSGRLNLCMLQYIAAWLYGPDLPGDELPPLAACASDPWRHEGQQRVGGRRTHAQGKNVPVSYVQDDGPTLKVTMSMYLHVKEDAPTQKVISLC